MGSTKKPRSLNGLLYILFGCNMCSLLDWNSGLVNTSRIIFVTFLYHTSQLPYLPLKNISSILLYHYWASSSFSQNDSSSATAVLFQKITAFFNSSTRANHLSSGISRDRFPLKVHLNQGPRLGFQAKFWLGTWHRQHVVLPESDRQHSRDVTIWLTLC